MGVTSDRLRLLYVLDNYWPNVGGAERGFKALCEGMVRRGHSVTVLTSRLAGTPPEETVGGVKIVRVGRNDNRYVFSAMGIAPACRLAAEADIVHSGTFNAAPVASIAGMLTRKPTVLTVFETWIGRWRDFSDFPSWKATLHDVAERAIFAFPFDRYIGISHSTSRRIAEVVPLARDRTSTVYFDFDPAPWREAIPDRSIRDRLTQHDAFLIVGYGRPGTSKGFAYLVDAFHAIRERVPHARMALVLNQTPQYARALEELKARAPDGVTFVPSLPFRDLISLVSSANCVVVPSLTEGFGYTTLEACATGVPVVASDTTSIPEVIGGRYAMVAPRDASAIARAVVDVSQGIANERPLPAFPLTETLEGCETIYRQLLAAKRRRV